MKPTPITKAQGKHCHSVAGGLGALLLLCLSPWTAHSDGPAAPLLQVMRALDGSNLMVTLRSQPGWFYTWQGSGDLTHWAWRQNMYAAADMLTWTTRTAALSGREFFRAKANRPNISVTTNYHGWTNVVLLSNGIVEALCVPAAGRVLQFRFAGATNGPFWENRLLFGRNATSGSWNTEGSFGGDKAWPSPQSDWGWPPPVGFDGSTNAISHTNGVVELTTPIDAAYRIRATRIVELGFDEPVMRIRTVFERVAPTPRTNQVVGVWVVTQLRDPVRCVVRLPSASVFPEGYTQLGSGMPAQYTNAHGFISFTRDRVAARKLGFDADSLVWVGTNLTLRIDAPRVPGRPKTDYPDNGSNTQIYTNPGAPYVEHEFLGPLQKLAVGERMELLTTYVLFARVEADPVNEARRVLAW